MSGTVVNLTSPPLLLGPGDPPPSTTVHAGGARRAVLFCDHASWAVPAALHNLGLDEAVLKRHIGWDIGIADVTRGLAAALDAPAVLAGYSRLVVDCNRPLGTPASMPKVSDGVVIPGNQAISPAEAAARVDACFTPYHAAVDAAIDAVEARHGGRAAVISMHSFTPVMGGFERPWHVGVLWDHDAVFAHALMDALAAERGVVVGDNEPYSGREPIPYSIPAHALAHGRPHVTIEIRQDLIDTHHGAAAWVEIMARALGAVLAESRLYRALGA